MKILIINNETLHLKELIKLFEHNEISVSSLGEDFDENYYDLYIFSGGSHHSVFFEPTPYQKEINFVKNTKKMVVGICLGCQIIAKAYHSIIDKLPEKVEGMIQIEYDDSLYNVFEAHRYSIKKLGKDLCGLGRSEYGYEIIKHKDKSIRGFQFHPEKHMKFNEGRKLLKKILNSKFNKH